jgi:hypothetical protein
MSNGTRELILTALSLAAEHLGGSPLFTSKKSQGLFSTTSSGRQAAQLAQDEGYLRTVSATQGKTSRQHSAITEKGLEYLLEETNPKASAEILGQSVADCVRQLGELAACLASTQGHLQTLSMAAATLVHRHSAQAHVARTTNGDEADSKVILDALRQWRKSGDCPLPELYRSARGHRHGLTIGKFHDMLRSLRDQGRIYLHPWTGPLYELAEPEFAMLCGHEIIHYASVSR